MQYDDTGPEITWRVKVGDPITKTWTVTIDDVLVTLTGSTLTGAIRASEDSTLTALKTFTMTLPTSSSVKAAATAFTARGSYWWAIRVELADGRVWRCQGPFIVEPAGV